MQLKQPALANVNLKMARGLTGSARQVVGGLMTQVGTFLAAVELLEDFQSVEVKPGEETELIVELTRDQLPANADVKSVEATLHVMRPDPAALKGMEQVVVGVKDLGSSTSSTPGAPERSFALKLDAPGGPRNVELRLGGEPVFWSHAGTLAEGPHPLPDFSAQLNAILDDLTPGTGTVPLRFRLKSDTPGKVRIQISRIEFSLLHTQSWTNPLDNTLRVDRNLQLDFGSRERIPLQPPQELPGGGFTLANLVMDIGGELGAERVLGSVAVHGGREFATISSEFSLAQSFSLDFPIRLAGLSGFFIASAEAELYAEVQVDAQGIPANGAALCCTSMTVPAAGRDNPGWTYLQLDPVVNLEARQRYWMVLKGIRGEVTLGLKARQEEPYSEVLMNRGGQLWKRLGWAYNPPALFALDPATQAGLVEGPAPQVLRQAFQARQVTLSPSSTLQQSRGGWHVIDPEAQRVYHMQTSQGAWEVLEETLVGLLRMVYLPEIDNQTAAVEICLEGLTDFHKVDPPPEAQSFTLPVSGWQGQALVLEVRSHARGMLSVANLVQEYRPARAAGR